MESGDKDRKKAWKAAQREKAESAFPLTDDALERLFTHVADAVEAKDCDHTLSATEAWLAAEGCDREAVLSWLRANGGYCDCEVVANAMEEWESNR